MKDDLAHPHDLLARTVLYDWDIAASLFENYIESEIVECLDFESLRCESPTTIDENLNEKIGDLRFATKTKDGARESNVFFFLEHQSTQDRHISFRALEQIVHAFRQFIDEEKNRLKEEGENEEENKKPSELLFPYPIVVVLYHGKRQWKKLRRMHELICSMPGGMKEVLGFHLVLIDLSILHKEKYRGHPVVQALFLALQCGSTEELDENFEAILNLVLESGPDERLPRWLGSFIRYICSLSDPPNAEERIRKVCTKLLDEETVKQMTSSLLHEKYLEGEMNGVKIIREMIIDLLEKRFGSISYSLREKINSQTDLNTLKSLGLLVMESQSLEEFENELQQPFDIQ